MKIYKEGDQIIVDGKGDICIVRYPDITNGTWNLVSPDIDNITVTKWHFILHGKSKIITLIRVFRALFFGRF